MYGEVAYGQLKFVSVFLLKPFKNSQFIGVVVTVVRGSADFLVLRTTSPRP